MIGVTIGGVVVGIIVLLWALVPVWPEPSKWKKKPLKALGVLLPFLYGWAFGALGTLTVMGLIGMAFDTALWASNWLGDTALWLGVGESPGQAAQGVTQPLTTFGNCMVLILTVLTVGLIKRGPDGTAKLLKLGVWSGLCLGTSSSIAALLAVPLAQGVNALGQVVVGGLA